MNYQDLNGKALIRGVVLYLTLYMLHLGLLPLLAGEKASSSDIRMVLYALNQFIGLVTCLAPGYLAGRVAGRQGFMHGGIVGGVSTVMTALLAMVWAVITGARFYGIDTLPFWVMVNVFLGAVAGIYATNLDESADKPSGEVVRHRRF